MSFVCPRSELGLSPARLVYNHLSSASARSDALRLACIVLLLLSIPLRDFGSLVSRELLNLARQGMPNRVARSEKEH